MSPISIGVLAVSMSLDAFIASVGKGAAGPRPSLGKTLRTGLIFGVIEALTPLIGWAAGVAASQYVSAVDHWIAFALLAGVGLHMALHADNGPEGKASSSSLWSTIATAVGTSIDAMAVGVSLAFLQVNILMIALAVGITTMLMSSTGLLLGRFIGQRIGRIAEKIGGVALIGLGALILWEHLSAA
ncbi:manganese efflux pump MntP family protein [Rhodovulum sp. YEN HP10]|uniref:manganese efflux pump MntP n=1 Tax=Rhodovulum sp. HP10 TaxID=3387397 RepID=UPI0039E1E91F